MDNIIRIIKEVKIEKWKEGGYRTRITIEGTRKAFYGKTKVEVKNKIKEYLTRVENGYKNSDKILFGDYIEYWLKSYKLNKIEPSSYILLWNIYENKVKNTLGKEYINDITTKKIQNLIDTFANPTDKKTKPLARSGLKRIKNLINPCLKAAVKEEIIKKNPCEGVVIPIEGCLKVKTKEQFSLTDEELELFKIGCLEKMKHNNEFFSRNAIVLLVLVNLGLRINEMVALKWSDVDYNKKTIRINKIVQINLKNDASGLKFEGGIRIKESSKTKSGVRILPLNEAVEKYLNLLTEYDKRNGIKSDYIACNLKGGMSNSLNFTRSLNAVKKRMGLNKAITLHTLRHTFGSHLIKNNVGVEVVSKLMGHSNITVTYNNYIHVLQEEEVKAMRKVNVC